MCEICSKIINKASLKQHMLRLHDIPKRLLPCPFNCGKEFKAKGSLSTHMRNVHSNVYRHECKICGKKFKVTTSTNHMVRTYVHTDIPRMKLDPSARPLPIKQPNIYMIKSVFFCSLFQDGSNLTKHSYLHTKEKPHNCMKCGQGFIRKDQLQKHTCRM